MSSSSLSARFANDRAKLVDSGRIRSNSVDSPEFRGSERFSVSDELVPADFGCSRLGRDLSRKSLTAHRASRQIQDEAALRKHFSTPILLG